MLDGGAHFYGTYACADGKFVSVGAIEPQFYALLLEKAGIADAAFSDQNTMQHWPQLKDRLARLFLTKTRAEWCALLEGSDACFAPVLDWDEAPLHPHNQARQAFVTVDGVLQPAPAPRFSHTPAAMPAYAKGAPDDSAGIVAEWSMADRGTGPTGG
jgi:alpha-methylacyl-CoA racemase